MSVSFAILTGCASIPAPSSGGFSVSRISPGLVPLRTVVIDAGHGGHDPGTSHYGLREKDLNLDITRRLRDSLKSAGLSTVMTRDRDEFLVLRQRPAVANRLHADLFLSVHINANRNRQVSGVEVYYPRESVVDAAFPYPPRVQPNEIALPTVTVKRILWDVVLSQSRRQSAQMARRICQAMQRHLQVKCRGVRGARFVVLREAWMPAVLVEVGYLSNRREASRLASTIYRQAIADAITEGVVQYLQALEPQPMEASRR